MAAKLELTELGRHEAWLRISSILKAEDKQIKLERKLTSELIKHWRESYSTALKELFALIPDELSEKAIEIVAQGLSDALGPSFGQSQKVRELFRQYIRGAYEAGKSEFMPKAELDLPDVRAIEVLTRHNCYWLGEHYGEHIGPKIAELTQQAVEDGLGQKELASKLRDALGGQVGGYEYWDIVSSAALVRSRSFGCISGMEEAGITKYEILAMADERMCQTCGEMDGRVFWVSEARELIDRVLDIKDPQKFKEVMPWQKSSPEGISNRELMAGGMSLPPFHGRCRCILVMAEVADNVEVIRGVPKDRIDELRGFRSHENSNGVTALNIQNDYKRVGIDIDIKEADKIYDAVNEYSGPFFIELREVFLKSLRGESLSPYEQAVLDKLNLCAEYTKVAPTYQPDKPAKELYRGLRNSGRNYSKMLLGLRPGDMFDLQKPSSFSSEVKTAKDYARMGGIILHAAISDIRDAVSIKGIAYYPTENEILVNDHLWTVTKIEDKREDPEDSFYHITLKRKD